MYVSTVAEGMLLFLFSGLQQQKRKLAPVETSLVDIIRIEKRHLATGTNKTGTGMIRAGTTQER
jgi:hypothetical protein